MRRRVVITGMGLITPLGLGIEPFWTGLLQGRRVIGPITHFDASRLSTRIAAEVKEFDPTQFMERKDARRASRFIQFAVAATRMALADAQLEITPEHAEQVGVLIGSGIGRRRLYGQPDARAD
jgi:3-oxoacyl-[acyl-carrier-protein] synthase II